MSFSTIAPRIEPGWLAALSEEFSDPYFAGIKRHLVDRKRNGAVIYPQPQNIFHAFDCASFDEVKVVLIGQDPYHGPDQAHGLCFSVPDGVRHPPSLRNIFKEVKEDIGTPIPESGNLERWANQGVLLLNAVLTVEQAKPASHAGIGWERFTDAAIQRLSEWREGIVFLLWGRFAHQKAALIDTDKHLILTAAHPSPFSAEKGFFGCRHFSKANRFLLESGQKAVEW